MKIDKIIGEFKRFIYFLIKILNYLFHMKFDFFSMFQLYFTYPGSRFRSSDPEETCRKETEKTLDPPRIHRNVETVFRPKIFWIFPRILTTFLCFPLGSNRKSLKKNAENFLPEYYLHVPVTSGAFCPEPSRIF